MSSLLTNVAARTALTTLSPNNRRVEDPQQRGVSGLEVAQAEHSAAYWSVATTMRSDQTSLSIVEDALGVGSATIDVVYAALQRSIALVLEIREKLVVARASGSDRKGIQNAITELQSELVVNASTAVFSGENWLAVNSGITGYDSTKEIISSFSRAGGAITIDTIGINVDNLKLFDVDESKGGILDGSRGPDGLLSETGNFTIDSFDISTLTDSAVDLTTLESYLTGVDRALEEIAAAVGTVGSVQSRVILQDSFLAALMDGVDQGVGQIVDPDLNEETTRIRAQQAQSQLGIEALSIASPQSQNILALF